MNGESAGPALLAKRFVDCNVAGEHVPALKAQVQVTIEVFKGVLVACSKQNGIAAECLLRSLFDSVINVVVLAKHPEKHKDFVGHGKFMHMRMMRFITDVPAGMKKHVDSIVASTEAEWQQLFDEFKNTDWHKLGTKDSFIEAEYSKEMYDKYFRPASAYAHAAPYIVVYPTDDQGSNWTVGARPSTWKHHAISAYNMACLAMIHMVAIVSRELKLGYEEELKGFALEADKYKQGHMDAIKAAFEEHYRRADEEQPKSSGELQDAVRPEEPQ